MKGVLQKGGDVYKPPEGHKLALYFHQLADGTSDKPTGFVELANYDARDGSFTVPGARATASRREVPDRPR